MEKLKEHLTSQLKSTEEYHKLEKIFGSEAENMFNFLYGLSKHKLEDVNTISWWIRKLKFQKKKPRMLGTKSKAMPEKVYQQLLLSETSDKIRLLEEYEGIQGPRGGDAVQLKLNDLNFDEHEVTIFNTKAKRFYTIPLNKEFETHIKDFIANHEKEIHEHKDCVFFSENPHQKRDHLSSIWFNRHIVERLNDLGLEREYGISSNGRNMHLYSEHSLRGHAASRVYGITHNIRIVQKLLDHMPDSVDVTMLYIGELNHELATAI